MIGGTYCKCNSKLLRLRSPLCDCVVSDALAAAAVRYCNRALSSGLRLSSLTDGITAVHGNTPQSSLIYDYVWSCVCHH